MICRQLDDGGDARDAPPDVALEVVAGPAEQGLHGLAAVVAGDVGVKILPDALDAVRVGAVGRQEVQHDAAVEFFEGALRDAGGVDAVVIDDEVDVQVGWNRRIDRVEEFAELDRAVPRMAFARRLRTQSTTASRCGDSWGSSWPEDVVPDETTILRFRHLLEKHGLTKGIFDAIKWLLEEKQLFLRSGTIVDATIISAPSSTKNATKKRDPEMKQTRKGNNWFFGMKLHIGADKRGLVHTVTATNAAGADIKQLPQLLHGDEREVFGDQAYWKEADRVAFEACGVRYRMNRRPRSKYHPLSERWRKINRARSRTRARGEHPFRVIKTLWGFTKVRYRGLMKNLARAQTMFALANLYQVRRHLLPA